MNFLNKYKLHNIKISVHGFHLFHAGEKRLVLGFLDTTSEDRSSGTGLGGSVSAVGVQSDAVDVAFGGFTTQDQSEYGYT